MSPLSLSVVCLLVFSVSVRGDGAAGVSVSDIFSNFSSLVQSARDGAAPALEDMANKLTSAASSLTEGNADGSSLSRIIGQMQNQINQTITNIGQNPEVGKLIEKVKTGVQNLQERVKRQVKSETSWRRK